MATRYQYDVLTPVEFRANVFFKRDDLYKPFDDFDITGGKVRQALYLIQSNLDHIQKFCDSTIATAASVHSPQATIIARVAKAFSLKCIIGHGAKYPLNHRAMQMCEELGAELVTLCTSNAYNNVLYGKLKNLEKTRKFFTVNFGYQATTDPSAILSMNAIQTQNLPWELDMLVINVGSGVSAAGILSGVFQNQPMYFDLPKEIHLIQPFGYDRYSVASQALSFGDGFHYHVSDYPYHKPLKIQVDSDLYLDEIYEAKGYDWMLKNLDIKGKRVCYWLIGNSNALRTK